MRRIGDGNKGLDRRRGLLPAASTAPGEDSKSGAQMEGSLVRPIYLTDRWKEQPCWEGGQRQEEGRKEGPLTVLIFLFLSIRAPTL